MDSATPHLKPLNDIARSAVQRDTVPIDRLPFRVGRESRVGLVDGAYQTLERRKGGGAPNNDLYLIDRGEKLNVSREHFQIEKSADGSFSLFDRGSACGTHVDDVFVGGHDRPGRLPLKHGSRIQVGTRHSPYLFEFVLPAV